MKRIIALYAVLIVVACSAYAQSDSRLKEEQKVVQMNYLTMRSYVSIACEDAFAEMSLKYKCSNNDKAVLRAYINNREWRKAAHNYMERDPVQRVLEKQKIDSIYLDSINSKLLFYNQISGKSITLALKMQPAFKLSDKKYNYLMKKALGFARRYLKDKSDSFKREEMDALKKILSKKQVEIVLNEKNRLESNSRAQKVWDALDRAQMTNELDSVKDIYQAQRYFSKELLIGDLYYGQSKLLENNYSELYRWKPQIIKMYEALDQREEVEKTKKEKKVGVEFAW